MNSQDLYIIKHSITINYQHKYPKIISTRTSTSSRAIVDVLVHTNIPTNTIAFTNNNLNSDIDKIINDQNSTQQYIFALCSILYIFCLQFCIFVLYSILYNFCIQCIVIYVSINNNIKYDITHCEQTLKKLNILSLLYLFLY
eukprot:UN03763